MRRGLTFSEALELLAAEMPRVRQQGYCAVTVPRLPGDNLLHTCMRAREHTGSHLCGCGLVWDDEPGEQRAVRAPGDPGPL